MNCAGVLALVAGANLWHSHIVAELPGLLAALAASLAAGGRAAASSARALANIAGANADLAQLVGEAPGALAALADALAGRGCAARHSALTIWYLVSDVGAYSPGRPWACTARGWDEGRARCRHLSPPCLPAMTHPG